MACGSGKKWKLREVFVKGKMFRTGFRRQYASALKEGDPGGGRGGREGGGGGRGGAGEGGEFVNERTEMDRQRQIKLQKEKSKLFRERLEMEGNRRKMGGGNILSVLKTEGGNFSGEDITKLMRDLGFKKEDLIGLQENAFRPSQVEFIFEEEVEIELESIEQKLKQLKVPYSASRFEYCEEVLMVYGMPFSKNIEKMKEELKDSVKAYVSKIVDCSPCYYHPNNEHGEYFAGKLTGAWRMKVVPKKDLGVPSFIVVGKEKAQGRVVYTKKSSMRKMQCSNCYSEDHLMNERDKCPGVKGWKEYCEEFEERWKKAREVVSDLQEHADGKTETFLRNTPDEGGNVALEVKKNNEMWRKQLDEVKRKAREGEEEAGKEWTEMKEREKKLVMEVDRLKENEIELVWLKEREVILLDDVRNMKEKAGKVEKELAEKENKIKEMERLVNEKQILENALEGATRVDNLIEGVENKLLETSHTSVTDLDPVMTEDDLVGEKDKESLIEETDKESEDEGVFRNEEIQNENGDAFKEHDDEVVVAVNEHDNEIKNDEEKVNEKEEKKRQHSGEEWGNDKKSKIDGAKGEDDILKNLGIPETTDRVWVKMSESDELLNLEVASSKEPLNPKCVRFNCKYLDGNGEKQININFRKHEWGYLSTDDYETDREEGGGGNLTPNRPPPPHLPPRKTKRNLGKTTVIKRTDSVEKMDI